MLNLNLTSPLSESIVTSPRVPHKCHYFQLWPQLWTCCSRLNSFRLCYTIHQEGEWLTQKRAHASAQKRSAPGGRDHGCLQRDCSKKCKGRSKGGSFEVTFYFTQEQNIISAGTISNVVVALAKVDGPHRRSWWVLHQTQSNDEKLNCVQSRSGA